LFAIPIILMGVTPSEQLLTWPALTLESAVTELVVKELPKAKRWDLA
jgi:hypothetical protein